MNSALLPDPSELEGVAPIPVSLPDVGTTSAAEAIAAGENDDATTSPRVREVTRHLLGGTSALGLGIVIERGSGFAANILAARLGGAATFGAYSLAITTANNIATYAAAGIGATAARFSGKYQYGTSAYGTLARVLGIVSVLSALVAAGGLWLGAVPLAHLLGQPGLTSLLRWAALSAAGIVLLECARGFFVGQRRLVALVVLSVCVGAGMLSLVPLAAASHSPIRMIASQGGITLGAVVVCLLLAGPLGLRAQSTTEPRRPFRPMLREVWGFGFVQLAGLVGTNMAGWWLTTLVARGDTTLVQMGFFGIASQLRNIVGLAPGLLTEGSYAVMADPEGEHQRTPEYVLGLTTFASSVFALLLAGAGILLAPLLLRIFYTRAYSNAAVTVAVALALAVMHMGNAPAAARLSIVSIRTSGVINTVWAIVVAVGGTVLMLHGGSAAMAMTIYLAAHTLSSVLVLAMLAHRHALPRGLSLCYGLATGTAVLLAALAHVRADSAASPTALSLTMVVLLAVALVGLALIGRRHGWLPRRAAVLRLLRHAVDALRRRFGRLPHAA